MATLAKANLSVRLGLGPVRLGLPSTLPTCPGRQSDTREASRVCLTLGRVGVGAPVDSSDAARAAGSIRNRTRLGRRA
jgi:hypothetical protein